MKLLNQNQKQVNPTYPTSNCKHNLYTVASIPDRELFIYVLILNAIIALFYVTNVSLMDSTAVITMGMMKKSRVMMKGSECCQVSSNNKLTLFLKFSNRLWAEVSMETLSRNSKRGTFCMNS